MPRTERQIAEFMAYYSAAPKEEREWALKYLADCESKSPAEIRSIYEKYKESVNLRSGRSKAPDELIKRLKEEVASGISYKDVAKKYGVSLSLVQTATKRTIDEPKMDKDEVEFEKYVDELEEKRAADKSSAPKTSADFEIEPDTKIYLPHDSDGAVDKARDISAIDLKKAINENYEKIREKAQEIDSKKKIESEAKNEVLRKEIERQRENTLKIWNALSDPPEPGEPLSFPFCTGCPEVHSESGALWKALLEQLSDFALGTFGAGTKITSVYWSNLNNEASVEAETVDGRKINITMEEYANE